MKVTFFLLLVAAVAFLAMVQPAVEAAPQDVATAIETGPAEAAETGSDLKPEGGAAAGGSSSEEQGGKKGHGKGKGQHGGKGGKGGEKGGKGKGQANKEKGGKGQANKGAIIANHPPASQQEQIKHTTDSRFLSIEPPSGIIEKCHLYLRAKIKQQSTVFVNLRRRKNLS
ncbi:hypothetical protein quinque_007634 [Culex quinquefasciatus]